MASRLAFLGRARLLPRAVGLVLAAAMLWLHMADPIFLQDFRERGFDLLLRRLPGKPAGTPIIIVDIDSKSLAGLGQWPWPRTVLAETLRIIASGGPKAVGLDIVFAEPDRTSPREVAASLAGVATPDTLAEIQALPDHDQALAGALLASPTVLGFVFGFDEAVATANQPMARPGRFAVRGFDPSPWLFQALYADANLPLLEGAAVASGFFNIFPDTDGLVRKVPLLMAYGQEIYPSLMLETLATGLGSPTVVLRLAQTGKGLVSSGVKYELKIGEHIVPTDEQGAMRIRYCGPAFSFPYLSLVDVLDGTVAPEVFAGAYVLVGTSAPGLMDIRATPTAQIFPGVEIHAHALNTILTGAHLRRPDWIPGLEQAYLAVVSLLLIILLPRIGAIPGGVLVLATSAGLGFASYWLFAHRGFLLDMLYPLLTTASLFTSGTFLNFVFKERESRKIRGAFGHYVSPAVVHELLQHPERLTLTGEERPMTILFSDIRGFTSISEGMTPQELCQFINEYLTPMTQLILDARGTVDKFIGDAIMAFWNAPQDDPEHAVHACQAALAMLRRLPVLNREWQARGLKPIGIGVGIHSGPARVGNMGSDQRFDYTAMGDTVNLASRLEGVNKLYGTGIIASAATRDLVTGRGFAFRQLDRVRVKGKGEPVTIFELVEEEARLSDDDRAELAVHAELLAAYGRREFAAAAAGFTALAGRHDRLLYRLYAERASQHLATPPPADWEPVTNLTSK
ncbi:MAG: adenylate/guanylate cyclase domain-containing protein [Thermodesulfobacteriota bacterium]